MWEPETSNCVPPMRLTVPAEVCPSPQFTSALYVPPGGWLRESLNVATRPLKAVPSVAEKSMPLLLYGSHDATV